MAKIGGLFENVYRQVSFDENKTSCSINIMFDIFVQLLLLTKY